MSSTINDDPSATLVINLELPERDRARSLSSRVFACSLVVGALFLLTTFTTMTFLNVQQSSESLPLIATVSSKPQCLRVGYQFSCSAEVFVHSENLTMTIYEFFDQLPRLGDPLNLSAESGRIWFDRQFSVLDQVCYSTLAGVLAAQAYLIFYKLLSRDREDD
jgi:hypothetical protein